MSRQTTRWVAIVQIILIFFTGCHPIQPFYARNNPSLANYLDQAMSIEYADAHVESLPEATHSLLPHTHDNMPTEFHDWSLEDCISIALQNTKMIRAVSGSNLQSGSIAAALLSAQPGQLPSVYDAALVANVGNTQPLVVDSQGTRIASRGSVRANQVGGVEHALSEFDTQFSTVLGYNTTDRPRNVGQGNVFNPQFFTATDSNFQAALSKRMATGTVATARMTTVYSRNNIPASGNLPGSTNFGRSVPSDYTAALEVQLNQPLMRGRGTLVNRIPVVLARINEDIALHQFEANVRNLMRDVEHAYWDLYMGYRAVEAARTARDSALDLWRVAEKRATSSDTGPAAVAQAAGRYSQFQAQLNISINGSPVPGNDPLGLVGRERVLREKMGLAPTDGPFIRPSEEPTLARVAFDWEAVKAEGLVRNTELRTQKWSIKQRELEVISAKNQILPQLDLVGTYRWLGVGDELIAADRSGIRFPNPGSNAFEEMTTGDYQEVGARLEFTPAPIGSRREKLNILASQMQLKKSHEELRTKELMMMHQLESAWVNVASTHTSMVNFFDQLRENQKEIDIYHEQLSSDSGDMSQLLDALLRAEEIKARAQLQYFQSIVEYNKSIVNIHYLKGSLFDLNNVTLGEGAWVDKAYWDAEQRSLERAGGVYFDYGYTRPAVVSQGPVDTGSITEGNVSESRSYPGAASGMQRTPEGQPEEVPSKPNGKQNSEELELAVPMPPTARHSLNNTPRSASIVKPNATRSATVKQASATAAVQVAKDDRLAQPDADQQSTFAQPRINQRRQPSR
ncbi:MAG: TolC family protein [Pirellulaceae bacterium]|nr:TolC family protein [Pirellulaceae bacterium]